METTIINGQEFVTYKGKKYQLKTFDIMLDDEVRTITVAPQSLADAMTIELMEKEGTEENDIDCEIYHFIDDDAMDLPIEVIAGAHLDESFELPIDEDDY